MAAELGLADPQAVPAALGKAGLAFRPVIRGGRVAAVEVEHTWVSAYVPYTNYRGRWWTFPAVLGASGAGGEAHHPAAGHGVLAQMGFSPAGLRDRLSLTTEQLTSPLAQIRLQVEDYLQRTAPGETYAGQLGSRSVTAEDFQLLPSSLPVPVVAVTAESPALTPAEGTRVRIVARSGEAAASPAALDVELPLSAFLGQRVTLSYTPAEVEDHRTVNAYGGLYAVPAYLIRLRPQLKIGGRPVDVGEESLPMAVAHRIEVQLTGPWGSEIGDPTGDLRLLPRPGPGRPAEPRP